MLKQIIPVQESVKFSNSEQKLTLLVLRKRLQWHLNIFEINIVQARSVILVELMLWYN